MFKRLDYGVRWTCAYACWALADVALETARWLMHASAWLAEVELEN